MARPWLFDLGAYLYGVMTAQKTWRTSCARLAHCFPPDHDGQTPRILDLGCGPGVSSIILAQALPEATVIGVDLAPRMLDTARFYTAQANMENRLCYVLADAAALPFANSAFELTTGHSFLYLVQRPKTVVQEAFRVLRPGGRIASMEPRKGGLKWGTVSHHLKEVRYLISVLLWRPYSRWHGQFDDSRFRDLYSSSGFRDISTEPVQDGLGLIGCGEKP